MSWQGILFYIVLGLLAYWVIGLVIAAWSVYFDSQGTSDGRSFKPSNTKHDRQELCLRMILWPVWIFVLPGRISMALFQAIEKYRDGAQARAQARALRARDQIVQEARRM